MTMNDLWSDIKADSALLDASVEELKGDGADLARKESAYKITLAKAILEERSKGTPATLVRDLCQGREDVSTARLDRDCAQSVYDACRESINAVKLQIRVNNDQLAREWQQAGMRNQ